MKYLVTLLLSCSLFILSVVGSGSHELLQNIRNDTHDNVRMPQIRRAPPQLRSFLVRDYARRMPEYSDILILGDSQTYGHELKPQESLGARLREREYKIVFNMSIVDGRFSDQMRIIEILKSENKRFKHIIFNIDPAHFKNGLKNYNHLPDTRGKSLALSTLFTTELGIYMPFLILPYAEIPLLHNKETSIYNIDLYDINSQHVNYFDEKRANREYYSDLNASNPRELIDVLRAATAISDNVLAFASPTSYEVFNNPPYDWDWNIRPVVNDAINNCKTVARVACADLTDAIPHKYFIDLIHLNPEGQSILAERLDDVIRGSGKERQDSSRSPMVIP